MHQSERQQSKATVAVARSRRRSGSGRRGWSQLRPTPNDKKKRKAHSQAVIASLQLNSSIYQSALHSPSLRSWTRLINTTKSIHSLPYFSLS